MKTFIPKVLATAFAAALPMLANAQLTGNVSLTTNYKFRGQDQDVSKARAVKPAIQGGFDYAFGESGFYVGNWNSSVDWLSGNSIESDIYGGYKF
ncbi:TorF family putative porin, partial [Acidovorax sp.]|uniref:TorF family putative porin n=1 Tax=Acidovorax sp. TaxID=1872122 RepID=UPI00391F9D18